jgi:tryptophan-rich sensory protein
MKINFKVLIISLVIVFLISSLGSLFMGNSSQSDWYQNIKPSITPPNYIFGIVWPILFILIALSIYFAWINSKKKNKPKLIIFFGINLVLNFIWTLIYFKLQNPFLAFIDIILILISIGYLIIFTYKINKLSSYLLYPYLLWVSFATILNYLSL